MLVAICTAAVLAAVSPSSSPAGPAELARYQALELYGGAITLPVPAAVQYRYALDALARGERDAAERHLQNALALRPDFADAHFTLARLYARQLDPEAVYHFVQGFVVTVTAFEPQRALFANAVTMVALVLIAASAIAWIALAVRYFPFLAHSVAELLKTRFNAAAARLAAMLVILAPFALMPGYAAAAGLVMLAAWPFMHRHERVMSFAITAAFAVLAWFTPVVDRYSTAADPGSLVSLIARANHSAAGESLAHALSTASVDGLEAERQTALGIVASRTGDTETAAAHFLRSISIDPGASIAYINLGNVYYLNGQYDKALEGYRKAEQVDSTDAVAHYNLAQAYIKTLLMSESSRALGRASQLKVGSVIDRFAEPARARMSVYPRPYSSRDLWRMAGVEGRERNPGLLAGVIASATGQSPRTSFWIAAASLLLALIVQRAVRPSRLAFQCSNCGELACDSCCKDSRGAVICHACTEAVGGVSSDKVVEALLRQRRQSVVIRRRRSIRWMTIWLPGMRHIFFGRAVSGFFIAALFAFSALMLWTRGYPIPDWDALFSPTPRWQWILPALGVALSYWIALSARQRYEARNTRTGLPRSRPVESGDAASQWG